MSRAGRHRALNESGFALVLVLLIVGLLSALAVEFSYGVYSDLNSVRNWEEAQRLSLLAGSAMSVGSALTLVEARMQSYTYPSHVSMPLAGLGDNPDSMVVLEVTDENSKFNVNRLVHPNGSLNDFAYESFVRLLEHLELDPVLADSLVDFIDPDNEPRSASEAEDRAKNGFLHSPDEMVYAAGYDRGVYDKLRGYITIWGDGTININGAEVPVIVSLSEEIDVEMAQRVVDYREETPFENPTGLAKVAGFETLGISLMGKTGVKASAFSIRSEGRSGEMLRLVDAAIDINGKVLYWLER